MNRPIIPPELADMIIDHLRNDKVTLASCSLVNRTWVPRSHRYLFSSITLHKEAVRDLSSFQRLLERNASICLNIQELSLRNSSDSLVEYMTSPPQELFHILNKLPALHTLRTAYITYPPLHDLSQRVEWRPHRKLRLLEMVDTSGSRVDIAYTLSLFANTLVEELRIEDCMVYESMYPLQFDSQRLMFLVSRMSGWEVTRLVLHGVDLTGGYADLLTQILSLGHIQCLTAGEEPCIDLTGSYRMLFDRFGHRLSRLRLDTSSLNVQHINVLGAYLVHCTSLQSLHLQISSRRIQSVAPGPLESLDSVSPLLELVSRTITEITLGIGDCGDGACINMWLRTVKWEYLEYSLLSLQNLRCVTFIAQKELFGDWGRGRAPMKFLDYQQEYVQYQGLPALHEAGLLAFE